MNKVSESIWNGKNVVIPMAEVSYVEKAYYGTKPGEGKKPGDLYGVYVFFKHSKWNNENSNLEPNKFIPEPDASTFLGDWCYYRYEVEGGEDGFKGPESTPLLSQSGREE